VDKTTPHLVHFEVNTSGAWKRVLSFEIVDFEEGNVEAMTDDLMHLSVGAKTTARIILPGVIQPLCIWNREHGWREWGVRS
jgi:hypothetical protein